MPNINHFERVLRDLAAVNLSIIISVLIRVILRYPNIFIDQIIILFFLIIYISICYLFFMRIPYNWKKRWKVILANNLSMISAVMIIDFINIEYEMININLLLYIITFIMILSIIIYLLWHFMIEKNK